MDRQWIPVCCAKCQAPLLRVERTSAEWPEVEVRRRSRRPGPDRTRWVSLEGGPRVVHCDDGHLFAYPGLYLAALEAARAAVMEGAERGFLAPTRAGRDGPVMVGAPAAARRDAVAAVTRMPKLDDEDAVRWPAIFDMRQMEWLGREMEAFRRAGVHPGNGDIVDDQGEIG